MTPDEQMRADCARRLGWRKGAVAMSGYTGEAWFQQVPDDQPNGPAFHNVPNYPASLDACREIHSWLARPENADAMKRWTSLVCNEQWGYSSVHPQMCDYIQEQKLTPSLRQLFQALTAYPETQAKAFIETVPEP